MKNFKKIASLAVLVLMLCGLMMFAVSCGGDSGNGTDNGGTSSTQDGTTATTQGGTTGSTQGSGTTTTTQGSGTTDSTQGGGTTSSTNGGTTTDSSNNNPDTDKLGENQVKVTVRYENGKPVKGADVQICQGSQCFFMPIVTGNDGVGVGEYDLNGDILKAKVRSIGNDEYLVPSAEGYVYFEEGSREIVIIIAEVIVNVIDNNENGVDGAEVQLYQGEHKFENVIYTDGDGIAYGYLAVSGETISAVVTDISGDYIFSKTPVEFEDGEFECTINVEKSNAYVVKLSHLVGGAPIANIKVELYKKGSNMVQKTRYTDANGIARFEDVKPGEYAVKIVFENPAYSLSRDSEDGKFAFEEGSTELVFVVTETPVITYTVTAPEALKGEYLSVYDGDHNYITDVVVGEDGKATFEGKNGNYIVTYVSFDGNYYSAVVFEKDKTANGEMKMTEASSGSSKETPNVATGSAYIYGEGTVWVAIPFPSNKTLTVDCYMGTAVITWADGSTSAIEAGTYVFDNLTASGNMLVFSISGQDGEMDISLTVSAPGTYGAPFDVNELVGDEIDGKELGVSATVADVYYKYTIKEDGTITISIPETGVTIYIDGKFIDSYIENDKTMISYPAKAGEEVVFCISGGISADTTISFKVEEVKKTYTATVYLDFVETEGVVAILYKVTDDGLVEVARVTTDANGIASFGELIYSGDYAVKVVAPENYSEQESEIYFEYASSTVVYINHVKDGSVEYPFEFDTTEMGGDSVSIGEGQTVWYNIYIMPSHNATLIINSANVQFEVYYEDELYGTSQIVDGKAVFAFADNERQYVIKVSSIDGTAVDAEYEYVTAEAEAGSDVENAKDVEGGFGDVVGAVAGQVVYYRYFGEACKLTVTVDGNDVVLVKIIRSLDGDSEEVVEGNCLVIEDTAYDMVFFAVKASSDTTFEVSVEVE